MLSERTAQACNERTKDKKEMNGEIVSAEEKLLRDIFGANGKRVRSLREDRGLSMRQAASKLGLTLRKMRAIERDEQPKPKLEKRVYSMRFIEYFGYAVHVYDDRPVVDKNFNLQKEQERAHELFGNMRRAEFNPWYIRKGKRLNTGNRKGQ